MGDVILSVNGESVEDRYHQTIMRMLREAARLGEVELQLMHPGKSEPITGKRTSTKAYFWMRSNFWIIFPYHFKFSSKLFICLLKTNALFYFWKRQFLKNYVLSLLLFFCCKILKIIVISTEICFQLVLRHRTYRKLKFVRAASVPLMRSAQSSMRRLKNNRMLSLRFRKIRNKWCPQSGTLREKFSVEIPSFEILRIARKCKWFSEKCSFVIWRHWFTIFYISENARHEEKPPELERTVPVRVEKPQSSAPYLRATEPDSRIVVRSISNSSARSSPISDADYRVTSFHDKPEPGKLANFVPEAEREKGQTRRTYVIEEREDGKFFRWFV